ncbi:hypothetical protein [Streptomyces sp. NPDC005423]|uniref:hypothetical protein n=1 Tax=Streptomyces sp. NPDC005423 TaxID=3155343 RepID=UPI0033B29F8C
MVVVLRAEGEGPDPAAQKTGHPAPRRAARVPGVLRTVLATLLTAALAALLVLARSARPVPYGDHLTVHARAEHATEPRSRGGGKGTALRTRRGAVEAYDRSTGDSRWRYAREGRRPLAVLPARGEAITLWDDGLVTDTDGRSVRWHRALPATEGWLPAQGGSGVLRPLERGILAVVTPSRVAAYRTADGDLRWAVPARQGCAFEPARAVRHGATLLLAQPCAATEPGTAAEPAWTGQVVAVDDLGRITPGRRPLGDGPTRAGKVVARPR